MSYAYIIAIDQGTHSTRAIIYDQIGKHLFQSNLSLDLNYVKKHHVEQDGAAILQSCRQVLNDCHNYIQQHQLQNVAVALTTQRSTVIGWHARTGEALCPALSWLDTRAQNTLLNLDLDQQELCLKTGLRISAHYGASKLRWLLEHNENIRHARQQQTLLLGPLAAFLVFNLLENHPVFVDYANAQRTLLWNIHQLDWDAGLLNAFAIERELLPQAVPNTYAYGDLQGLGYPLVLVNGDQNAAVYGYAQRQADTAFVNVGTGGFVIKNSALQASTCSSLLTTITHSTCSQNEYAIEGTINGAGAALSWAKTNWKLENILEIDWKSETNVPVFLNSVGGLGSPWWKSNALPAFLDARKTFADYSPSQCKAALMESIVFLIVNNIEAMQKLNIQAKQLLLSGGLTNDAYFCQRLADASELPVTISRFKETTSRGAAWLAFGRPDWDLPLGDAIQPNATQALAMRYQQFTDAITRDAFTNRLIAHRGDMTQYPENSLMAIQAALKLGYRTIEIDIQLSKDYCPMVIHDDNLLRTAGVDKKVCDLTAKELGTYSLHHPSQTNTEKSLLQIPRLSTVVSALNNHPSVTLFVEIKRQSVALFGLETVARALLEDLKTAKFEIVVISFIAEAVSLVQSYKLYSVGWVLREYNQAYQQRAAQMQPDYLFCNIDKIDSVNGLWRGPWQWALYNVQDAKLAHDLIEKHNTLVEIDDIVRFAKTKTLH